MDNKIDPEIKVMKEYLDDKEIKYDEEEIKFVNSKEMVEKPWSPSAIEIFLSCKRRFYLKYIVGIPEDEEDDPTTLISSKDLGTLSHKIMEVSGNTKSKEEFMEFASNEYDKFFKRRPPIYEEELEKDKKEFLQMMENAFDMENENEIVSSEKEYEHVHESGIKLHGFPDRIEKSEDGKYYIIDFKTKREIEHIENDTRSCIQTVIYAWLSNEEGMDVDSCEYRYIRLNRKVGIKYTEGVEKELNNILLEFKDALENNKFDRAKIDASSNTNVCEYCRYKDICKFELEKEKVNE